MTRAARITKSIRVYQAMHDMTNAQMAILMHMSEPTWKRKKGNPDLFTCKELIRLEDKTKIQIFAKEE